MARRCLSRCAGCARRRARRQGRLWMIWSTAQAVDEMRLRTTSEDADWRAAGIRAGSPAENIAPRALRYHFTHRVDVFKLELPPAARSPLRHLVGAVSPSSAYVPSAAGSAPAAPASTPRPSRARARARRPLGAPTSAAVLSVRRRGGQRRRTKLAEAGGSRGPRAGLPTTALPSVSVSVASAATAAAAAAAAAASGCLRGAGANVHCSISA